jgi:membrane-bound lytic murein transglycosylase D
LKNNLFIIKGFIVYIFILLGLIASNSSLAASNVWDVLRKEFRVSHEVTRPEVQEQIRWLVAHPSYIDKVSRQSEPFIYHVIGEIKKRKLPGEIALLPMVESAYDPFVYSGAGAAGIWQLMPKTGRDLGLKQDWWLDGRKSIRPSTDAALNYLVYLNKFFNGNWILAFAAYDSGEGTIARAIKATTRPGRPVNFWNLPVSRETKLYIPRLLALAEVINNPKRYRINLPSIDYLPYFEEVNIGSQLDLTHAAKLAGVSYKEIKKLNPGLNRWTTPPHKPYKLLIPAENVKRFNLNLSNLPASKQITWTKHQVKKGDSLNTIAARYHTTVNMLKSVNQLTGNTVKSNQSILIPKRKAAIALAQNSLPSKNKNTSSQHLSTRGKIYTIKRGDSLSVIAKRNGTKVKNIISLNPGLKKTTILKLGRKIQIA